MTIKVIEGHNTNTEKKVIKHFISEGIELGTVKRKTYHVVKSGDSYDVRVTQKDRGVIPVAGSELRFTTHYSKIKIK